MRTVNIEEKAFMGILLAAVEVFPSKFHGSRKPNGSSPEGEVHGLLFGQRIVRKDGSMIFNVTLAIPNQMVLKRTEGGVEVSNIHIDRVREVTELFPSYTLLGSFHSHPYRATEFKKCSSAEPSEVDQTNAIGFADSEELEMLDLIFSITRLKKRSCTRPQFLSNHMIHASCGAHKYTLACYSAVSTEEEVYSAVDNLICTTAAGLQSVDFIS